MPETEVKTILLVEDEAIIALSEAATLKSYGFRVQTVYTGEAAVEAAVQPGIDLVLMDINLGPGIDGTQAAQRILARRDLPVVFLSSHTERAVVAKTEGITSYGYIVKNSGETVLIASIKMAFRLFGAHRRERAHLEALRESEANLKESQRVAHVGHWCWDTAANTVTWSDEMIRIFGLDPETFHGDLNEVIARSIHPDDHEKVEVANRRVLSEQKPAPMEYRVVWPDGNVRTVWAVPGGEVTDSAGNILKLTGIVQDITERKRAQEAMLASEAFFRIIVNHTRDWELWLSPDGALLYTSPSCQSHCGRSADEIRNDPDWVEHILHPDDRLRYEQHHQQVVQEQAPGSLEFRILQPDGSQRWIGHVCQPVFDDSGRYLGVRASNRDIAAQKELEHALQSERDVAQMILSAMGQGLSVTDGENRFIYVNPAYSRMTGYTTEELLGKRPRDVTTPAAQAALARALTDRKQCKATTYSSELIGKDGRAIPVQVTGVPLPEQDGVYAGSIAVITDLTERQRAEDELRANRDRLQTLFETMTEGMILIAPDGQIVQANSAAERILGLQWSDIESRKYIAPEWDILRPDGSPMPPEEMAGPRAMREKRPVKDVVMGVRRPDGTLVWINVNAAPVLNAAGEVEGVVGTFADITEWKANEENLHRREQEFQTLVENSPDAITRFDTQGRYLYVNPARARYFGRPPQEIIGKTWWDLLGPDEAHEGEIADQQFKKILAEPREYIVEYQTLTPQGIRWAQSREVPEFAPDGVLSSVLVVTRDITVRKQAEEALQKAFEEKKYLLREMQHRAKNSFAQVVGMLSLLQDSSKGEEARSALADAESRVRALTTLYDLLYVSDAVQEAELHIYLALIVASTRVLSHISVSESYEEVWAPVTIAGPVGLILTELLTNAVKYAFPNSRRGAITVVLRRTASGAQLRVADDGVGFPAGFSPAESETMGLTLVYALAGQIRGSFRFESGSGVVSVLDFPV